MLVVFLYLLPCFYHLLFPLDCWLWLHCYSCCLGIHSNCACRGSRRMLDLILYCLRLNLTLHCFYWLGCCCCIGFGRSTMSDYSFSWVLSWCPWLSWVFGWVQVFLLPFAVGLGLSPCFWPFVVQNGSMVWLSLPYPWLRICLCQVQTGRVYCWWYVSSSQPFWFLCLWIGVCPLPLLKVPVNPVFSKVHFI